MTAARIRLALAVVVLLAAAAAAALLADAVFSVERHVEARTLAARQPSGLRFRIAGSLLGTGDEQDLRDVLRRVVETQRPGVSPAVALEEHGELEARLGTVAASGADAKRRSQAANLSGVLLYEHAALDPSSTSRYLELSLGSFRQAVKLDPGNVDAKVNLELLAALLRERQGRHGGESGSIGDEGASASPEGSGY